MYTGAEALLRKLTLFVAPPRRETSGMRMISLHSSFLFPFPATAMTHTITRARMMACRCSLDSKSSSVVGDQAFSLTSSTKCDVDYLGQSTRGDLNLNLDHLDAFGIDGQAALQGPIEEVARTEGAQAQHLLSHLGIPSPSSARNSPRGIFCSRTLNLRSISTIGYDMDYTLIHYNVKAWEGRAYDYCLENLRSMGFPVDGLAFDSDLVIRGLVIDKEKGNLVKADRFGYVKRAMHGTTMLSTRAVSEMYGRELVDLRKESRWEFLNTLFSVSEAVAYMQMVDRLDDGAIAAEICPPDYKGLYKAVGKALFRAHVEGQLKSEIMSKPELFVEPDPELPLAFLDQKEAGKRLLLITNSDYHYTDKMMKHSFNRFLPNDMDWRDLFEMVIVSARKPEFFQMSHPLYEVVTGEGLMRPCFKACTGGLYSGGSSQMIENSLNMTSCPSLRPIRRRNPITPGAMAALLQGGGKMVVELVGAFNELTERMNVLSSSSSRILFKVLKLSIPILQDLPLSPDGRSPLSKALSLAILLADLQMDAEVISAGILTHVLEVGAITMLQIRDRIGTPTAHLLHEALRVKNIPSRLDLLDDDAASSLRTFCLTYYDIRALILDLALKLDAMRHLDYLPRYQQQILALQVMKLYAPLAHAVGTNQLSLELEDLSFRCLFPHSYLYLDTWLCSHQTGGMPLIDVYIEQLRQSLKADTVLSELVEDLTVNGRYKSRYSTMKKLLKDGRKPEEVNDVLGLRVIVKPRPGEEMSDAGEKACYRTREIVQSLWKEMPHRTKDYIATPKANGYKSLHMAVDVSDNGEHRPPMEIQIRTLEMDKMAADGIASHSLYKAGFTDSEEAKRLKAIMMAAAELAALRLRDLPSPQAIDTDQRDQVFRLLDKNGDGRISIEELMEVMEELGAPGEDAREMMQLLDSNSDGSLSPDEFDTFQRQVVFMHNLEDIDHDYKNMLDDRLQIADESGLA